MDSTEGLKRLDGLYKNKDWFHSTGMDTYGRYVVYTTYMNHETLYDVVGDLDGKQVLVHFASSKTASKERFMNMPKSEGLSAYVPTYSTDIDVSAIVLDEPSVDDMVGSEDEEKSILHLLKELDRLERVCGSQTLGDIFFEIQDGKNAVTDMSARYPEIRKSLDKLYEGYGFDVLYEELEL